MLQGGETGHGLLKGNEMQQQGGLGEKHFRKAVGSHTLMIEERVREMKERQQGCLLLRSWL